MSHDKHSTIADELAGECCRLIGITEVVAYNELDALAEDPTRSVEIRDRQIGGV
jgi:hypothetical protein